MRADSGRIAKNAEGSELGARDSISGAPLIPRLLNLREAAHYTGLSTWTLREFLITGELPAVRFTRPGSQRREDLRRVLVDRADLDAWIDRHREGGFRGGESPGDPTPEAIANARGRPHPENRSGTGLALASPPVVGANPRGSQPKGPHS